MSVYAIPGNVCSSEIHGFHEVGFAPDEAMRLLPGSGEALDGADALDHRVRRAVLVVRSEAHQRRHHGTDVGPPPERPAGEGARPLAPAEQLHLAARVGVEQPDRVDDVFGGDLDVAVGVVRHRQLAVGPALRRKGGDVVPVVGLARIEQGRGQHQDDVPRRGPGRRRAADGGVECGRRHIEGRPRGVGRRVRDRRRAGVADRCRHGAGECGHHSDKEENSTSGRATVAAIDPLAPSPMLVGSIRHRFHTPLQMHHTVRYPVSHDFNRPVTVDAVAI